MKFSRKFIISICLLVLLLPVLVSAQSSGVLAGLEQVAEVSGLKTGPDVTWQSMTVAVLNGFLGFFGFILVALIIYGGFIWMTAAGDESKVEKAKGILKNAILGLLVVLLSISIMNLIFGWMGISVRSVS